MQLGQKLALGGGGAAIGLAHAQRHFVGVLAQAFVLQAGHGLFHAEAFQQYVLVQGAQVDGGGVAGQCVGNAPHFFALAVVFGAVGKGGVEGNGKNGFLVGGVHVGSLGPDGTSVVKRHMLWTGWPEKKHANAGGYFGFAEVLPACAAVAHQGAGWWAAGQGVYWGFEMPRRCASLSRICSVSLLCMVVTGRNRARKRMKTLWMCRSMR